MVFWDNLSQKASKTTVKAMQKAKEISDIAKLNSMISDEETIINNNYYQIGKLYTVKHINDYEEDFSAMISTIKDSNNKIRIYRQQIQDIKGVVRCEQCGSEIQSGSAFCSSCGAPMPKIQSMDMDNLVKCESCGSMVKKDVRFCTECGKVMIQFEDNTFETDMEETTICPECGAKIENNIDFCTQCGKKLI